jgi:hypothetical protein
MFHIPCCKNFFIFFIDLSYCWCLTLSFCVMSISDHVRYVVIICFGLSSQLYVDSITCTFFFLIQLACVCVFDVFYIQLVFLLHGSMECMRKWIKINKTLTVLNSIEVLHDIILQFYCFISNDILHCTAYLCLINVIIFYCFNFDVLWVESLWYIPCKWFWHDIVHLWQECHNSKFVIFQENLLKVLKCYNFLWVQRW